MSGIESQLIELRAAAGDLLDWIERTGGALFREEHVEKRGRIDVDASSANQEHNNQVRDAIERLRVACGPAPALARPSNYGKGRTKY